MQPNQRKRPTKDVEPTFPTPAPKKRKATKSPIRTQSLPAVREEKWNEYDINHVIQYVSNYEQNISNYYNSKKHNNNNTNSNNNSNNNNNINTRNIQQQSSSSTSFKSPYRSRNPYPPRPNKSKMQLASYTR